MAHYFTNDNTIKSNIREYEITIKNKKYMFSTDNGVFSKSELDEGTKILLEQLPLEKMHGNILDVGCGYGPIGIFIADNTDALVHMIDVNLRALHLTKMNVKANKINNAKVYESDIYQNVTEKFDYIITNPPIRAGKKIVYEIIFKAKEYLNENGKLWLVIRKDQGAKSLLKDMAKDYNTEIVCKINGFFVISAEIR